MTSNNSFSRDEQLARLDRHSGIRDIVVIGGGATGVGIAIDAASRGYRVALFEQHDFGKGTSSRSTKLIHGGVRYLQQGNLHLVREALRERGRLRANAPHLVYPLPTIVPLYQWWEPPYYRLGLKAYDLLAGSYNLARSSRLSLAETVAELPTIRQQNLRGGISYFDAGFDDARLLISMVQTAVELGAVCLNYSPVVSLLRQGENISGVVTTDRETGQTRNIEARVVINAAGPFSDEVRRLDNPQVEPLIAPSQGIHLVVSRSFLPGNSALIVPKTTDGRVVFAIPWNSHTLIGTTDTPLEAVSLEPRPQPAEVEFLLETVADYLDPAPTRADVLSIFAGIRPLVAKGGKDHTSKLGRDHAIRVSTPGLVSIVGGKWTAYRQMAQDGVDRAAQVGELPQVDCRTHDLTIAGGKGPVMDGPLHVYGDAGQQVAELIASKPAYAELLDDALVYLVGQVVWAVRHEMARTVEDVLARRLRALFLNAPAALRAAPYVADLLVDELGHDAAWKSAQLEEFTEVAQHYLA